MAKPTLDERFADGPPERTPSDLRRWLNAEERRFVIWALKEQWSCARIGRALGVNEATVRRFRKRFWEDPEVLLELDLLEMVGDAGDAEYRCLVCADRMQGRPGALEHVLLHFVGMPAARQAIAGLSPHQRRKPGR